MLTAANSLSQALYSPQAAMAIDRHAQEHGLAGSVLMERAGMAAWYLFRAMWPRLRNITVCCGGGNNGGDGAVFARHAAAHGCKVQVLAPAGIDSGSPEATAAWQRLRDEGCHIDSGCAIASDTELVVDAIFGTGFRGAPDGVWLELINAINAGSYKVLALDVPSGLDAGTGYCPGVSVTADMTISFIVAKHGLFTASGPACCGRLYCDSLAVPEEYIATAGATAKLARLGDYDQLLAGRRKDTHKGIFGHVLVVGGNRGMAGAVWMAAAAAARTGAGLVSIATRPGNLYGLAVYPEIMAHEITAAAQLEPLLQAATVVIAGPGLGRDEWAVEIVSRVLEHEAPLLLDADALNLLVQEPLRRDDWILTPHPGEAARLLNCSHRKIQQDRLHAATEIQQTYGGVAVLKGSGSIVAAADGNTIIAGGNPGMACGGMGDTLGGVIAAMVAQGMDIATAAKLGTCLHAEAGDACAFHGGERGLQPTDILPWLRRLCNPAQRLIA